MAKRPDIDLILFCLSLLVIQFCIAVAGPSGFAYWCTTAILAGVVGIVVALRIAGRSNKKDIVAVDRKSADVLNASQCAKKDSK